ncbi:MAG: sigma 54 modulation/S30EA ribosomal C-terminal domain-containing protein [Solirubrobacteraceae bacterium]
MSERSRFSSPIDLRTAVAEMDALDHRFVFFEDATTERGNVIYRRYDGHYGLIEPA